MMPGDRLVCAFVRSLATGEHFKEWPLHITIVPWFRADVDSTSLATEFRFSLHDIGSFEVVIGDEARFGRDKLVSLVKQPTPLNDVERRVRHIFKSHQAWIVDETTKRKRSFRPHVTEQKSGRLHAGDTFICDRLYIIEQKGDYKEVVSVISLDTSRRNNLGRALLL